MGEEEKNSLYLIKGSRIRNLETGSLQEEGANRQGDLATTSLKTLN